jgi:hypothetical protein
MDVEETTRASVEVDAWLTMGDVLICDVMICDVIDCGGITTGCDDTEEGGYICDVGGGV